MSIFESLKTMGDAGAGDDAHDAVHDALESSPLGGMSGLLDTLHEGGLDQAVESWTTGGEHLPVTADQLKAVLDEDHVKQLADHLGVSPDAVLSGLAEHLPMLASAHEAVEDHDDADEDHDEEDEGEHDDVEADEPAEA